MRRAVLSIISIVFAAFAGLLAAGVAAQDLPSSVRFDHSSVRMLAGGVSEKVWTAGVEITLAPDWKTYWRVPGDAGVPPNFDWKGSENLARVDIDWPAPKRYYDEAGESIGYKNQVVFPIKVIPIDPASPVRLKLELFYAVCNDICIPGNAKLALALSDPSGVAGDLDLINEFQGKIPSRSGGPINIEDVSVEEHGGGFVLAVKVTGSKPVTSADIFVEGSDGAYFRKPKLTSNDGTAQTYHLQIDGLKTADELKGQKLMLTVVDKGAAIARETTID